MDRRIVLRSPTVTRSGTGAAIQAWSTSATVWARWLPQNSREFIAAQARYSETTGLIRIRYRADVLASWRIHLGGVLYKLAGDPIEVGRREYLDLPVAALNPVRNAITDETGAAITDETGAAITT